MRAKLWVGISAVFGLCLAALVRLAAANRQHAVTNGCFQPCSTQR
jgi:hypothetical protein